MKIILTEKERNYLISLLREEDIELKDKLLKAKRKRKTAIYKKCEKTKKENFDKLEEIIKSNFKLSNEKIFERLEVSKATFYAVYAKRARELKKIYKSQSLF